MSEHNKVPHKKVSYLAKMRFNPNTGNFEWEGTKEEVLEIYDEIKKREQNNAPQINDNVSVSIPASIKLHFEQRHDMENLSKRMPSVEQLMFYILGKSKFEHDIVEIEKKFFDKQINSRKYGKLYRELRTRLETARKSIEVSNSGAFVRKSTPYRNLPAYTFKKINATPIDTTLEKTSQSSN